MPQTHKLELCYPDIDGELTLWTWGQGYMAVLTGTFPDGYPIWMRCETRTLQAFERMFQGEKEMELYEDEDHIGALPPTILIGRIAGALSFWFYDRPSDSLHKMKIPLSSLQPFAQRLRAIRLGVE